MLILKLIMMIAIYAVKMMRERTALVKVLYGKTMVNVLRLQ